MFALACDLISFAKYIHPKRAVWLIMSFKNQILTISVCRVCGWYWGLGRRQRKSVWIIVSIACGPASDFEFAVFDAMWWPEPEPEPRARCAFKLKLLARAGGAIWGWEVGCLADKRMLLIEMSALKANEKRICSSSSGAGPLQDLVDPAARRDSGTSARPA